MEARVARLEAHVEHIQADVTELRQDVKDMRKDLKRLDEKIDARFEACMGRIDSAQNENNESFESLRIGRIVDRVWMLLAMGALLGVMARGFKWI